MWGYLWLLPYTITPTDALARPKLQIYFTYKILNHNATVES